MATVTSTRPRSPEARAAAPLPDHLSDPLRDPLAAAALPSRPAQRVAAPVVQRVQRAGPLGVNIDVTEVENYLPNCVDNLDPARAFYRRTGGITSGWNDTDLFYADGAGALVQVTVATVNAYWDPKYQGFTRSGSPDWTVNCEDYAKALHGFGAKVGTYNSTGSLKALLSEQRSYVIELGSHWMSVAKTGDDALTIVQKDGESAIYTKDFNLDDCATYILDKYSPGGTVYRAG